MRRAPAGERLNRPDHGNRFSSQSAFWDLISASPYFGYQPNGWGMSDENKLAQGWPYGIDYHGTALVFELPEDDNEDSTESIRAFSSTLIQTPEILDEEGEARLPAKQGYKGKVIIRKKNPTAPIRIEGTVQFETKNLDIEFQNPILLGGAAGIRIRGNIEEFHRGVGNPRVEDSGPTPAIRNDVYEDGQGRMVLPMREFVATGPQHEQFQVGDWILIRGYVSRITGSALEKQFTRIVEINETTNELICEDGIGGFKFASDAEEMGVSVGDPFTFKKEYPDPDNPGEILKHPISGSDVTTRVKVVKTAFMTEDHDPGDIWINVGNTDLFERGDMIILEDDRHQGHLSLTNPMNGLVNDVGREICRIAQVDAANDRVLLENPLARDYKYTNGWRGRITKLKTVDNCTFKFKEVSWFEDQVTRNATAIALNYCTNSRVSVGYMDGWDHKFAQGIRVSECYNCAVENSVVVGNKQFGSGEGYGITLYYSTKCRILNCYATGCRHSYLLQGTTDCEVAFNHSTDDLITAIDTHGTSCIGSHIHHNRCIAGKQSAASNKCGIRIGNSSHVVTDRMSIVEHNIIGYYEDNDSSGMEVVAPSAQAIFRDNFVYNCAHGFQNSGQNTDRNPETETALDVFVMGNIFRDCPTGIEIRSEASGAVRNAVIRENLIQGATDSLLFRDLTTLICEGNTVINAAGVLDTNPVDASGITNSVIRRNGES